MSKTITWDKAFKLVQHCEAVMIKSHSNMLVYPVCFTNEENEGDGATIELRPNFHKIEELDVNKFNYIREGLILLDGDMNKEVLVNDDNNLVFKDSDPDESIVEIHLLANMIFY